MMMMVLLPVSGIQKVPNLKTSCIRQLHKWIVWNLLILIEIGIAIEVRLLGQLTGG